MSDEKQAAIFLSITEVAARWGCKSDSAVREAIESGVLPAARIGKRLRIRLEDLQAYEDKIVKPLNKQPKKRQ